MARSHISPLLNPPRPEPSEPDIPAPPPDACPDCGAADWAWDGACWLCAGCHPEVNTPELAMRCEKALAWGKAHGFPRLPYASWTDVHPWSGVVTEVFYKAIAAGEAHWRGFLSRADAATLDLVAKAAGCYEAAHPQKEAA